MASFTTRLNLRKPGGGSTGLILPDEQVDIDVLNDNFDKIDAAMGYRVVTSGTRPATPFDGQGIYETDTKQFRVYRSATTSWDTDSSSRGSGTLFSLPTLAALHALTGAVSGDMAMLDATTSTGTTRWGLFYKRPGSTWRPVSGFLRFVDAAAADQFKTDLVTNTNINTDAGGEFYVESTGKKGRWTSSDGTWDYFRNLLVKNRTLAAANTFNNPGVGQELVTANADKTALTANFTKRLAASDLLLRVSMPISYTAGVQQLVGAGLRLGTTYYPISMAQIPIAPIWWQFSGELLVSGVGAGVIAVTPAGFAAGGAAISLVLGSQISWSVEEIA